MYCLTYDHRRWRDGLRTATGARRHPLEALAPVTEGIGDDGHAVEQRSPRGRFPRPCWCRNSPALLHLVASLTTVIALRVLMVRTRRDNQSTACRIMTGAAELLPHFSCRPGKRHDWCTLLCAQRAGEALPDAPAYMRTYCTLLLAVALGADGRRPCCPTFDI